MYFLSVRGAALLLLFTLSTSLRTQDFDGKISPKDFALFGDKPLELTMRSGLMIADATFVGPVLDPRSENIRFLEYKTGRRSVKAKVEDIGGYTNRFYSNVELPTWFAAGLPGALADDALPRDEKSNRNEAAGIVDSVRRSGSLNAILDATRIEQERKPLAKLLVKFLVRRDPQATTQYLKDIKTGQEPAVALKNNFGLTHETLALEFGRALNIPNVRPL